MEILDSPGLHPGLGSLGLIHAFASYHESTAEWEAQYPVRPTSFAALLTIRHLPGASQLASPAAVASQGRRSLRGAARVVMGRVGGFALATELCAVIHDQTLDD